MSMYQTCRQRRSYSVDAKSTGPRVNYRKRNRSLFLERGEAREAEAMPIRIEEDGIVRKCARDSTLFIPLMTCKRKRSSPVVEMTVLGCSTIFTDYCIIR